MRIITKKCKFCGKEFSYTTNIVTYQVQCNECKSKAYEEKLNNKKHSLIRELKKNINFENKYIESQQQDEELTNRMGKTNLWLRYQKENPFIYKQLKEDKIILILNFSKENNIDPKIKAYYYNLDDYFEYWCTIMNLTKANAMKNLKKVKGQYLIFPDNSIVEFEI